MLKTVILLLLVLKDKIYSLPMHVKDCGLSTSGIYVSVSKKGEALEDQTVLRWMEVHWWGIQNYTQGDWVAIWDTDPRVALDIKTDDDTIQTVDNQIKKKPLDSKWSTGPAGGVKFSVEWNPDFLPNDLENTCVCLPYWGAYIRRGKIIHISCLKLQPHWMWQNKDVLKRQTIIETTFPGIHENGYVGNLVHSAYYNNTKKWTVIPGLSAWHQLVLGIRHFDFGVTFDEKKQEFYILHGDIPVSGITVVLKDIAKFIKQTNEIVILSFSRVEPIIVSNYSLNKKLGTLLEKHFSKWAIPKSYSPNPEISALWKKNKRLLIYYSAINFSKYLWDPSFDKWFTATRLEDFLHSLVQPTMEEMGDKIDYQTVMGVVNKPLDQQKKSDEIHPLTLRLQRNWCPFTNILSADFFLSTDIVSIAIEVNNRFYNLIQNETKEEEEERDPCLASPIAQVWPTVKASSDITFGSRLEYRLIQINWKVDEVYDGDWIGVFNSDPRHQDMSAFQATWFNEDDEEVYESTEPSFTTLPPEDLTTIIVMEDCKNSSNNKTSKDSNSVDLDTNGIQSQHSNCNHTDEGIVEEQTNKVNSSQNNQTIGETNVTEDEGFKVLFHARPFSTKGLMTTTVTHPRIKTSSLTDSSCIGAWVGYIRDNEAVDARCITSHPSWMWDNREIIGNMSLSSLVIPGTHNSGSYFLNDTYDSVSTWVVCQDEDVITQLLYGTRYLDLRVGYYPDTPELLWINHDIVRWKPLKTVLDDIVAFITYSPDPVIVDIHRTPIGFDEDEHPEAPLLLVSLLNSTLGTLVLPSHFSSQVTLNQIWADGRRLIVSYGDSDIRREHPWLWPPIKQEWADAQTLNDLRKYLDRKMNERGRVSVEWRPIWAAMGHLTPTLWDILLGTGKGVRGMADRTGSVLTEWLVERWAKKANIITSDFFHTNDVIHSSIQINLMRAKCPSKLDRRHYSKSSFKKMSGSTILSAAPYVMQRSNNNNRHGRR